MTDRVRCFKIERPAEGGTQDDTPGGFTEVDIGQDYLDCAGVTLQRPGAVTSTSDALVRAERTTAGALHLVDTVANGTTGLDLSQLLNNVSGSVGAFNSLADIRLWIDGPGDGFASGAVRTRLGTAPNSNGYVWYKAASSTAKIFDCTITYAAGSILPATKTYRLYAADGATVLRSATDTFTWNGPILTQKTRTWS
jgi:hypothetical protein